MSVRRFFRAFLAAAMAGCAATAPAADLVHVAPDCRPFAQRELATPDAALGERTPISWYGDSRTVSACIAGTEPGSGDPVWSTLRETLPQLASQGRPYKQRARNGSTLRAMVAGKDGLNQAWPQQVRADHSALLVIAFGTNDASGDRQAGRTQGVAEFRARLDAMVREAQRTGHQVLLLQPHRGCDYAINEDDAAHPVLPRPDLLLAPYADAVAAVSAARHTGLARLFDLPARCDGPDAERDMPDGLHATQAFERRIAEVVATAVAALLPAPAARKSL